MAAQCRSPRCTAERKGFRRELDSWRHRLIHCVGFESILEGLYGPGLRRDLSLFDDCEPEELVDWCIDDRCSLCNLRKDAIIDCPISVDSAESTPTEELLSQGQFNTENIECQAENYLNALFQKKDLPQNCDPNIPLAAQELLKKMIRQFAIEYISKSRKILQGNHEAVADSAINGIQLNQTQDSFQEQDGPLDLTVTRLEENHIQDEDGVLDLSLKRNCNGYETNGKINSKNGVIRICMLKKLSKSIRRRKRNSTALTEVLHSLCLYHKQQIRLMLQFLTAERRLCSNVCRKTKESVTFQAATRDRFTTRDRLIRPASSPHLPSVKVCLEDLRLTCPNLTFGSIHLDSKKCGFEQLKSSNLVTINSKGKRHSCLVAANGTDAQPPKKRKRRTRLSSSSLSDHDLRCSQDATIEQHQDSKNNVAFSSISNNSEKNGLLDIKDSLLQDFLSFVNQKVNGKIPVAQPKSHTRNLRSTEKQSIDRVKFRKLVKCILNKTVQNGCSFKEALNRYVKNLEGDSMQTMFRKRKKTMPEFESPPSSLTRREVLQIKSELCSLMESLAKETKEAAKKSTRKPRTNKKVISNKEQVHDVLVMANCGHVHREDSFQKDVTELPQNNLKVDSTSVNCSKEIGLPKHLALAPKQKVTCAERSPRCHIGPKNPKDSTTSKYSYSDKSGKYKNGFRLQGDCLAQGASNCFCKCTSRQISKIFKGKVYGFPDLLKNISRKPHLKVIVERLKDSVFSANQQFSQPAPHNGKLNTYDLKRKRNPTVSHCCNASQSLGKPLNHVRKGTHLSVNRRNDNIGVPCGDRVAGAKRNQSTKVSTEQSMPSIPNRLCSPVKIMFLSNVDGAEGIKYSLSSVYVSGHEKSSEKPAESRIDRQDTCTTVLSEKSIDRRGTAPESKTSSHGWKESRTSEDACDKVDFYEKRPRRMPNRVAPLVLKQIRNPIGASPKIQIKQNAKCDEPKRNFTVCKRNVDNEHSGITLSIKFGSSTMRRCISRVNAPHFKGILCKKAQLPPSKINILPIGKRNSDKTRDSPNYAGKASICNFENRRTTRSNSARLQNPQELSMCKKSVTFKCHKTPEKRLPLSNTLPCFLQKRIDPEQAVEWKANKTTDQQSQRKPFNTRSLRSSVSRNCKLSSQATLSTSLNPMPSTLNAFRRNSKRCSLNKHKLINERCENMDEVCEPPSGNAEGLKSVINVLDSSASSIFQPNDVLKWWSSSSSKESLLQDLNHRYEQITNTWQKETDNEKSSSLQLSAANRRSFVQMMFDKKYDDKDISVWLMQTTETKSLSILPKANARQPSEENHHLGVKTRKKRTKKSKRRVRRLDKLRCRRVWNLNHIESPEDQSKDICLKFVCTRKILAVTVPEKCTLRKDVFESPTSSPPDSQAVAKGSALNCSNATTRVPRKKTGKLLDNEPMTTQTRCYANKPTINVKGCKAFISKPGGVEGKAPKENSSFLKPLHPRNSTEQNKCTLRSNHNFTVDFRTKRNKGRHWSLTKTLSTTLNSKNSELGKRSGLRKSRRTAITNPSVTWILERKMKRKRHGMVVSTCGEISPKKSKVPLTTRKEDVEYSKMKLGPLKPIGLPSPRGLSNKGGMYSLAPIRISHHGTNTKA